MNFESGRNNSNPIVDIEKLQQITDPNQRHLDVKQIESNDNVKELKKVISEVGRTKKSKKPRCPVCRVKLSLIDQSCPCRCESVFCQKHILPENHECTFDYKEHGRNVIKKLNPGCKADKVNRI